jgi:hypothetical protein
MDLVAGRQGNESSAKRLLCGGGARSAMCGAAARSIPVALLLAAALLAAGCGWFRWRALAETHVGLLDGLAADALETFASREGALAAGDIERLRYPLQRARGFAASSRRRFGDAAWLASFDVLVGRYADTVDWLDRVRTQPASDASRERARELAQRMHESATAARAALAQLAQR